MASSGGNGSRAAILFSSPSASVHDVQTVAGRYGLGGADLTVFTASRSLTSRDVPKSAFEAAVSVGDTAGSHTPAFVSVLTALLRPGAKLIIQEPVGNEGELRQSVLFGGLTGFDSVAKEPFVAYAAAKPNWEVGEKARISLRPKATAGAETPPAKPDVVKLWAAATEEDELLDEDELLTEEDRRRPSAPAAQDECDVGSSGRKACKNCSCGRAEEVARGESTKVAKLTPDMLENPQSACGNCSLGDAFRCAGCPYKGLPAFEMGKKIQLSSDFLTADAF